MIKKRILFIVAGTLLSSVTCMDVKDACEKMREIEQCLSAPHQDIITVLDVTNEFYGFVKNLGTLEHRVARFNEYKQSPEGAKKIAENEVQTVRGYIKLVMLMYAPRKLEKKPVFIADLIRFAKLACPSYPYWTEYYQTLSLVHTFKSYSQEELIELILAPRKEQMIGLLTRLGNLKGKDSSAAINDSVNWAHQMGELIFNKDKDKITEINLLSLTPLVMQEWKKKIDFIQQEIELHEKQQIYETQAVAPLITEKNKKMEQGAPKSSELIYLQLACDDQLRKLQQFQETKKRIESLLALFSTSQATDWQQHFIEVLETELKKIE